VGGGAFKEMNSSLGCFFIFTAKTGLRFVKKKLFLIKVSGHVDGWGRHWVHCHFLRFYIELVHSDCLHCVFLFRYTMQLTAVSDRVVFENLCAVLDESCVGKAK